MLVWPLLSRRWAGAVLAAAVAVGLLGPGAYTLATAATAHGGAIPSAGPVVVGSLGRAGAPGGPARAGGRAFTGPPGGLAGGPPPGAGAAPLFGTAPGGIGAGTGTGPFGPAGARAGGLGGLLGGTTVSSEMKTLLVANSSQFTWVAATVDANNAASYELATGAPVMAVGGFNGTDPSPTLAQFQRDVAARDPLLHRVGWWRARCRTTVGVYRCRDHVVGDDSLHRDDRRGCDGVRPHGHERFVIATDEATTTSRASRRSFRRSRAAPRVSPRRSRSL